MIRGTAFLVTNDTVFESIEFNGGMDLEQYGEIFFNGLAEVNSIKDFFDFIFSFNEENHQYDNNLIYAKQYYYISNNCGFFNNNYLVDFRIDYARFFSDYLYIKNLTNRIITFFTKSNEKVLLYPNQTICFNFGNEVVCQTEI